MLIAQISDVHVRPRGALYQGVVDSNRALVEAIGHLHGLDPRPDLVLITGDMVDHGDPAEYSQLMEILAGLQIPYHVIPGNHDERRAFRAAFPGHAPWSAEGPLDFTVEGYPVRILALDSTIPGLHHGEITAPSLAWLEAQLAADSRPTLVLLHHPPFDTGIPYMDKYGLLHPERLEAVLARFSHVERVLCGHVHRPMQIRWAGTIVCTCPSTVTQIALQLRPDAKPASYLEPPAALLHHFVPGRPMVTHTSYIGRFEGPFPFA